MAMQQNVVAALYGGPMAILAATGSVVACGCLTSFIDHEGQRNPGPPGPSLNRVEFAMMEILERAAQENGLVAAFAVVGLVMMVSGFLSRSLTGGRVQSSAIAILLGLAMAYAGGHPAGRGAWPTSLCSAALA